MCQETDISRKNIKLHELLSHISPAYNELISYKVKPSILGLSVLGQNPIVKNFWISRFTVKSASHITFRDEKLYEITSEYDESSLKNRIESELNNIEFQESTVLFTKLLDFENKFTSNQYEIFKKYLRFIKFISPTLCFKKEIECSLQTLDELLLKTNAIGLDLINNEKTLLINNQLFDLESVKQLKVLIVPNIPIVSKQFFELKCVRMKLNIHNLTDKDIRSYLQLIKENKQSNLEYCSLSFNILQYWTYERLKNIIENICDGFILPFMINNISCNIINLNNMKQYRNSSQIFVIFLKNNEKMYVLFTENIIIITKKCDLYNTNITCNTQLFIK